MTAGGAAQGGLLGSLMATFSALEPPPGAGAPPKARPHGRAPPARPPQASPRRPTTQPPGLTGGPLVLGRNFAVMTGVNAGLQCAIKKARGGVEDVGGSMAASFGAGACFSLVSAIGTPAAAAGAGAVLGDALRTGALFSALQGGFYQLGQLFSGGAANKAAGPEADAAFAHTRAMLAALGLSPLEKNFRRGQLDDATLPLLTDSALAEVKVPPGPRLRILHHVRVVTAQAAAQGGAQGPAFGALSLALPVSVGRAGL